MPRPPMPGPATAGPEMTRRRFLIGSAAAVAAAGAAAAARSGTGLLPGAHRSALAAVRPGRGILVVVTLYGGNDGLNTLIPATDSRYRAGRPTLGYQPSEVLALADGLGLHPALSGMKSLWDAGRLAVVRGVGYPDPVLSHFRSMDIWQSGSPTTAETTGIFGRWLDATGTDPMRAVNVGGPLPLLLRGEKSSGSSLSPTGAASAGATGALDTALAALDRPGPERSELANLVARSGSDRLTVEHRIADLLGPSAGPGPTPAASGRAGGLAGPLELAARLIRAGSPTRLYHVAVNGFDNHTNEKQAHARVLADLDAGVGGFFTALAGSPAGDDVVLVAYSEFGRRVAENASGGTDHGTAAPVFVAGRPVHGGRFVGDEPSLADLDDGNLRFTTDYRAVFATLLADVIGVDPAVALPKGTPTLPLF
ncbi:MAG TPA: DUF1501 domain-containing protein [Acidimicrobiia bacterium]|nr:DUF1501 domain-containing protein [Acidimicrobiia bacterium]